jgi:hypothetical protein
MQPGRGPALLAALALLAGCAWPTRDQSKLKAIKAESEHLAATHPIGPQGWTEISQSRWPPVIASLRPHSVTVHEWGVSISTKPYLDGGWGYHVSRYKRELPMPERCYSEPGEGVFWHGPC